MAHADDRFGAAVAADADSGIVGAPAADDMVPNGGSATIVHRDSNGRWVVGQTLTPLALASGDGFGSSVAILGNTAFVGAPGDDTLAPDAGAVYVFVRPSPSDPFLFAQKITRATHAAGYLHYGRSLAASNGRVVVGADTECVLPSLDVLTASGTTWSATGTVTATSENCYAFGRSVAIDGDRIAVTSLRGASLFERVGANWPAIAQVDTGFPLWGGDSIALSGDALIIGDRDVSDVGAAVIFGRETSTGTWVRRGTWEWTWDHHHCGSAVAIRGARAVVTCDGGNPGHAQRVRFLRRAVEDATRWDEAGQFRSDDGSAGVSPTPVSAVAFADDDRVLVGDGWSNRDGHHAGYVRAFVTSASASPVTEGFISRNDAGFDDGFGRSVAQRGEWLFVGSFNDNTVAESAGAVTVFRRVAGAWQRVQVLYPDANIETQYFGLSVALGDGFAAVGGSGIRDVNGVRIGGVHVYRLVGDAWQRAAFLQPAGLPPSARFGRSLAVDGARLAVGSPVFTVAGSSFGYVHVFERGADATSWTLRREISRTGPDNERPLGHSLALAGDVLVATTTAGYAWVYERNEGGPDDWGLRQQLDVPLVADAGPFNVATDGATIAIGVTGLSANASPGDVRVFDRVAGMWTLTQTISRAPQDVTPYSKFGTSVALRDGWLVAMGARLVQPEWVPYVNLAETYVRYFRRDGSAFGDYGRSTFATPIEGHPTAPDSPLIIGDDVIATGIPTMPGEPPANIRYAGAVFLTSREQLPTFVDGFE